MFNNKYTSVSFSTLFAAFALLTMGWMTHCLASNEQAVLQGEITLLPTRGAPQDDGAKIQPGTAVKINVRVDNKGAVKSPSGELYIRYALAHPLHKNETSITFQTEKKKLPAIESGTFVNIAFDTPHQIPSLLDFVRDDWSLREYQAIALIDGKETLIGTLAITFSAYYYPGLKKEIPAIVGK